MIPKHLRDSLDTRLPQGAKPELEAGESPELAARIIRDHDAFDATVTALKGVAIMLNTELSKYESEPWAQRVRAALALVDGPREAKMTTEVNKPRDAHDTCAYVHARIGMRCGGCRANHDLAYTDHEFKEFADVPATDDSAEKPTRQVAEEIVQRHTGESVTFAALINDIDDALRNRNRRAAEIADERAAFNARMRDGYRAEGSVRLADLKDTRRDEAEVIASAIRGKPGPQG